MSFFEELKRRNVFRVGIAYAVSAWILLQVVDLVLENIEAPVLVMKVFMLAMAIGFPLALIFAWAFEMTPDGVKLEKDVDRSQSITRKTASQNEPQYHHCTRDRGGTFTGGQIQTGNEHGCRARCRQGGKC